MSVRSFRVAGIRGLLNSDEVLSIQTAVRVAMEYQTRGLEVQAEQIYRSILSEAPQHADALHLLGVIFYQKGDAGSAVPYIERALQSNKSFEGFHNSLGMYYFPPPIMFLFVHGTNCRVFYGTMNCMESDRDW